MADYTSNYTGAQIDSAVGKVLNISSSASSIDSAVTKAGNILEWVEAQGSTTVEGCTWYWQKYSGGQFEAFMSGGLTSSTTSARKSATFYLPFTLPNTVYVVQVTPTTNYSLLANYGVADSYDAAAKTTTTFIVYANLTEVSASAIGVDITVKGYWK